MDHEHEIELVQKVVEVEARTKSNTKRLDKLEQSTEAINRMAISMEKMVIKQDAMSGDINKLTTDVETLKAEPGKRWKFVVEKVIYFVVAAVVGFVLAKIGL